MAKYIRAHNEIVSITGIIPSGFSVVAIGIIHSDARVMRKIVLLKPRTISILEWIFI